MDYSDEFHNQFVIVTVDKTGKSIGIVCKLFYLQVLKEEILSSGKFIQSKKTIDNIVHDYSSCIHEKYNIISTLPNLPFVYWIPKFHKNPIDIRYITSGR